MMHDRRDIFPQPPRRLSQHENRGTLAVIILGLVILVGITMLIPALQEEERLTVRHAQIWNEGLPVDGVVKAKERTEIGRKTVYYCYQIDEQEYTDQRVITHVDDFNAFEVGESIFLRVDPKDPQCSVIAVDVAPSFEDRIPFEVLVGIVFVIGGLMVLWGHHRRRVLRYGTEVPCTIQPTASTAFVRVTYSCQGVTRTRLVEGGVMPNSELAAVLLDPVFPSWPILGMQNRFAESDSRFSVSLHDLHRRWSSAMLPGTIGAWVTWGLLSLLTGESMSPYLRTACILIVGIVMTFISGRSGTDSSEQSDPTRDFKTKEPQQSLRQENRDSHPFIDTWPDR